MTVDEIRQVEVQLTDGYVDVVRVDAEARMSTLWGLFEAFPVCALERDSFEQDDHHQVETPYLIGLAKAIDPPHLALLVGVGQHAHGRLLARDAEYEVFPALLCYVLPQLTQQPRRPLLLHLNFLVL